MGKDVSKKPAAPVSYCETSVPVYQITNDRIGDDRIIGSVPWTYVGRDSSVGIATGYGLDDAGIESRWRRDFFAPVQTGPGAHPVSCTMGTGSFPVAGA